MQRRTLLKLLTAGLGGVFSLILGIPAIAYIIDPRHKKAKRADFKRVARLSELPKPKDKLPVPYQAVISDTRRDAWTIHPEEVIGRVWLLRMDDQQVEAF